MKKFLLYSALFVSGLTLGQTHTVYFDFDEANTTSSQNLESWIKAHPDIYVYKIYGYADRTGYAIYNTDLSQRRANHVLKQLIEYDISVSDSLDIKGFGEEFKLDPSDAKNRKAIIYYKPKEPAEKPEETKKLPSEFADKVSIAKVGDKLRLPNLYFYNYSDLVVPKSRPTLVELLRIMKENSKLKIDIQGHICCELVETGNISYRRAKAVYDYLVKNGIDKARLSFKGLKNTRPIYPMPEKNDIERDANRRVEIEIIEN